MSEVERSDKTMLAGLINHLVAMTQVPVNLFIDHVDNLRKRSARKALWKRYDKVQKPEKVKDRGLLDFSKIVFDDSYEIGIDIIDNKHRLIMLLYNKLVSDIILLHGRLETSRVISERLGALVRLLGEHFADEERIMLNLNYPKLFYHKCEHDEFMVKLLEMTEQIKEGNSNYEQLVYYIGAWSSGHMLISDRYFGEFCMSAWAKERAK